GERAWRSLSELPETPDHAFVMTPTEHVVDVVAECVDLGVPVVTVLASGFNEDGEAGAARVEKLLDAVSGTRTRLVGPSSLGMVNLRNGLTLTANAAFAESDLPLGSTLALSQSGSMIGALVSRGKSLGIGFASLVSVGNEIDLDIGQICELTLDDPNITSYALFLETIKGAQHLQRFAEGARRRGKPVVAYKLGRSSAGAELALSHTGALAGEDEVASAFLADCGIARVKTLDGLLESVALAHRLPVADRHRAPRVGVVTTTGGGAAMVVDQLGVLGIDVTPPSAATFDRFAEVGAPAKPGRIVDLTLAGTRYEVMRAALETLVATGEHDVVIVVVGSSARFEPEVAVRPIIELANQGMPLAAFLVPDAPESLAMLKTAGVPAFRSPESCADAVTAVLSRRRRPISVSAVAGPVDRPPRMLDELTAYQMLDELGFPHAPATVIGAESTEPAAQPFDYPVVAKVLSKEIAHKTDVGGVVLNIANADELREAVAGIRVRVAEHRPELGPVPILVQPMVDSATAEVLIGYRIDHQVGPIVLLAQGGELTEIYEDRCIRLAPVDLDTAYDMIASVRSLRVLGGFRSHPPGDVDALAHAIVTFSRLSESASVIEAEINPLIVRRAGDGVVAVDALIEVAD
ncbi:MAG TPA: acetate--CoA ligase family protein, partial [Micromonosporaceae bacterium]